MKIVNNVLATVLAVSSLLIMFVTTLMGLYGFNIIGAVFGMLFSGMDSIAEGLHMETTFRRWLTTFVFAAFAFHTILRFSFHFIEGRAIKIPAVIIVFFFLFSNYPAHSLYLFGSGLQSWLFYLLSLGILAYHLWGRQEDLELEKVSAFLKSKGIGNS
ncbi:MAG: hypothetical protein NXI25_10060 [bacterium]|nr:hypothetical protein [bacterium]